MLANSESEHSAIRPSLRMGCAEALECLQMALAASAMGASAAPAIAKAMACVEAMLSNAESLESRYRSLLDAVPDAVTVLDRDGRIISANRTAVEAYGYSLKQLTELSVFDLNPNLDPDRMTEVWRTFRPGQTVTVIAENHRSDGSTFPVEVHSNMFVDGDQTLVVAVARDISLRRQAEAAMHASELRYRQLFDSIDQGIIVQDAQGRVLSANAASERLLGLSETRLVSTDFEPKDWRFAHGDGQAMAHSDLPPFCALRTGQVIDSTVIGAYSPIEHAYSWFAMTAMPQFQVGEPRPFQVITLFSDVTLLKRQSLLFDEVQQLAAIGGWEYDFARDRLYWSNELYRLHAVDPAAAISLSRSLGFLTTGDAQRLRRALDQARTAGTPFDLEVGMQNAVGQCYWLRVVGHAQSPLGNASAIIGVMQDITARKQFEEDLKRRALTDPLTGLNNREELVRQLANAIDVAEADHGPTLLHVDLDRFKVINDLLGHAAGDELLVAAAQRLRDVIADAALVTRFEGDEFIVLLSAPNDAQQANKLAAAITQAFTEPFAHDGEEFGLTASIGIARYPEDGASVQQLIHHADAAMIDAKRRGRNNWQQFTPVLAQQLTDQLLIETQLRRALDNNEFCLHFQPQVELTSGRVLGAEALLRWHNRILGHLMPDLFIGHAENTGDIVRIGAWVIHESCRQLRLWRDQGLPQLRIAVNVSYRQFLGDELPATVAAALQAFDLPGDALELEMTERVLIEDVPDTLEAFNTLRGMGVSLVIDDFGEGYSALNYLRRLPFSGIKISHNFMHGIPTVSTDTAICEAIIRIAQSLDLSVIAEGVETELQRNFLLRQGTRFGQGFLFARALPAEDFFAFAKDRQDWRP